MPIPFWDPFPSVLPRPKYVYMYDDSNTVIKHVERERERTTHDREVDKHAWHGKYTGGQVHACCAALKGVLGKQLKPICRQCDRDRRIQPRLSSLAAQPSSFTFGRNKGQLRRC